MNIECEARQTGDRLASAADPGAQSYWRENRGRIAAALERTAPLLAAASRALVVGPSFEVPLLAALFPNLAVDTLGWEDHRFRTSTGRHHALDLNLVGTPGCPPPPETYAVVLCLEVIEHVHAAPIQVLRHLRGCIVPGGRLVLSTPNAAFLRNRWRLLGGRNPFEPLREDQGNPGHFRESTRAEMTAWLREAGFEVELARTDNLYEFGSGSGRWFTRLSSFLPAGFRHDLFFIARK